MELIYFFFNLRTFSVKWELLMTNLCKFGVQILHSKIFFVINVFCSSFLFSFYLNKKKTVDSYCYFSCLLYANKCVFLMASFFVRTYNQKLFTNSYVLQLNVSYSMFILFSLNFKINFFHLFFEKKKKKLLLLKYRQPGCPNLRYQWLIEIATGGWSEALCGGKLMI